MPILPQHRVFVPPFSPIEWFFRPFEDLRPENFTAAEHADANMGQLVVQLGTVTKPSLLSDEGLALIDFHHAFTPTQDAVRAIVEYSPVSVTVRSQGASVTPSVSIGLYDGHEWVERKQTVLLPGASPGTIQFSTPVNVDQPHTLLVLAEIEVHYQNRAQGYGETIVRFPKVTLTY